SEVKVFGQTLVDDHNAADDKVVALAEAEGITLAAHTPAVVEEKMPMGTAFDAAFARAMLQDHRKAIAAVKAAPPATQDQKLQSLLDEVLPVLVKHEAMAANLVEMGSKS